MALAWVYLSLVFSVMCDPYVEQPRHVSLESGYPSRFGRFLLTNGSSLPALRISSTHTLHTIKQLKPFRYEGCSASGCEHLPRSKDSLSYIVLHRRVCGAPSVLKKLGTSSTFPNRHAARQLVVPKNLMAREKKKGAEPKVNGETVFKEGMELCKAKMQTRIERLIADMNRFTSGKVSPGLLESLRVKYKGANLPLRRMSVISAVDATRLKVTPFDASSLEDIRKAIQSAHPECQEADGRLTVKLSAGTLEDRKEAVKTVKVLTEECKTSLRNLRRDTIEIIRKLEKAGSLGKDCSKQFQKDVQKVTEKNSDQVESLYKRKEKELLTI